MESVVEKLIQKVLENEYVGFAVGLIVLSIILIYGIPKLIKSGFIEKMLDKYFGTTLAEPKKKAGTSDTCVLHTDSIRQIQEQVNTLLENVSAVKVQIQDLMAEAKESKLWREDNDFVKLENEMDRMFLKVLDKLESNHVNSIFIQYLNRKYRYTVSYAMGILKKKGQFTLDDIAVMKVAINNTREYVSNQVVNDLPPKVFEKLRKNGTDQVNRFFYNLERIIDRVTNNKVNDIKDLVFNYVTETFFYAIYVWEEHLETLERN